MLAGAAMTAVLQSSSATTALAIILCSTGVIPFKCAMALILGDNVGTTLTANIAATMTNTDGKRAALSHLLFNLVGVLWALPLLAVLARGIASLVAAFGGVSPLLNGSAFTGGGPSRCSTPCSMSSTHCCWQASSRRRHTRSTG
ncbi:MAG: Na/Pi symporter [Alistipes indistinctus]